MLQHRHRCRLEPRHSLPLVLEPWLGFPGLADVAGEGRVILWHAFPPRNRSAGDTVASIAPRTPEQTAERVRAGACARQLRVR